MSSHFYEVVFHSVVDETNERAKRKNQGALRIIKEWARKWQGSMPFLLGAARILTST